MPKCGGNRSQNSMLNIGVGLIFGYLDPQGVGMVFKSGLQSPCSAAGHH